MEEMGKKPTPEELEVFMKEVDLDGNGTVGNVHLLLLRCLSMMIFRSRICVTENLAAPYAVQSRHDDFKVE